jgi:hypothetical protein
MNSLGVLQKLVLPMQCQHLRSECLEQINTVSHMGLRCNYQEKHLYFHVHTGSGAHQWVPGTEHSSI